MGDSRVDAVQRGSEKEGRGRVDRKRGGLITHPLAVECDGESVCNMPETEGGGRWEAGMTLEISGTRVDRNQATRTLREMVVENQGRGHAHHGWGVGQWDRVGEGQGNSLQQFQGRVLPGSLG